MVARQRTRWSIWVVVGLVWFVACRDPNGPSARQDFRAAILEDQLATVERWLEAGLDPNEQPTEECSTPLGLAARRGNVEILSTLLAHGARVNAAASPDGATALHCAVTAPEEYPDAVALLVQAGADVDAVAAENRTPLMMAVSRGRVDSVRLILEARPDLELRAADGKTAMDMALALNRPELVEVLRQAGARLHLPPPVSDEEQKGATGVSSIMTSEGLVSVGELWDDARAKIETGVLVDMTPEKNGRIVQVRRYDNQTFRLTFQRRGKTGPFELVRIEVY